MTHKIPPRMHMHSDNPLPSPKPPQKAPESSQTLLLLGVTLLLPLGAIALLTLYTTGSIKDFATFYTHGGLFMHIGTMLFIIAFGVTLIYSWIALYTNRWQKRLGILCVALVALLMLSGLLGSYTGVWEGLIALDHATFSQQARIGLKYMEIVPHTLIYAGCLATFLLLFLANILAIRGQHTYNLVRLIQYLVLGWAACFVGICMAPHPYLKMFYSVGMFAWFPLALINTKSQPQDEHDPTIWTIPAVLLTTLAALSSIAYSLYWLSIRQNLHIINQSPQETIFSQLERASAPDMYWLPLGLMVAAFAILSFATLSRHISTLAETWPSVMIVGGLLGIITMSTVGMGYLFESRTRTFSEGLSRYFTKLHNKQKSAPLFMPKAIVSVDRNHIYINGVPLNRRRLSPNNSDLPLDALKKWSTRQKKLPYIGLDNTSNVSLETLLKIFRALREGSKVDLHIRWYQHHAYRVQAPFKKEQFKHMPVWLWEMVLSGMQITYLDHVPFTLQKASNHTPSSTPSLTFFPKGIALKMVKIIPYACDLQPEKLLDTFHPTLLTCRQLGTKDNTPCIIGCLKKLNKQLQKDTDLAFDLTKRPLPHVDRLYKLLKFLSKKHIKTPIRLLIH